MDDSRRLQQSPSLPESGQTPDLKQAKSRCCRVCGGWHWISETRPGVEITLSALLPYEMVGAGDEPGTHTLYTCAPCFTADLERIQEVSPAVVKDALIALRERDVYLAQILFAARHLAESQIKGWHDFRSPDAFIDCLQCGRCCFSGEELVHGHECNVGRVLRLLDALQELPPNPNIERSVAPSGISSEQAGVGVASPQAPATQFYEPWTCSPGCADHYPEIYSSDNSLLFDMADSVIIDEDCENYARRIVACVNACAGMPTEELELLESGVQKTRAAQAAAVPQIASEISSSLAGGAQ
jgi:hypothetical protein